MSIAGTESKTKSLLFRQLEPERLALLVVILASLLAMSPNVADPDLWGHVEFGQDVLEYGKIPPTTSYSYTANGFRWINHENLSEVTMAVVVNALGPLGLVIGKFLLSLFVIIAVLRWNLKNGVGVVAASAMTLLVAANLGYHWSVRPQLSSFVGFTLLMLLLQYCFHGWRDRWHVRWPSAWFRAESPARVNQNAGVRELLGYQSARMRVLWLATLLFLFWANSHGGFVAGLAVFIAYLGMRALESISRCGPSAIGLVRRMMMMATVAVLATLLNPYGPQLHLWLLESLGSPRPEISDWSNGELFSLVGMKFWMLVATISFALLFTRRKLDATQIVILGLTLWQSISHFRHVPFFAIACGFWIGPHLESALARFTATGQHHAPSKLVRVGVQTFLVLVLAIVGWQLKSRLSDLQVYRNQYPVDAVDYMRKNHLHGRLVVTYDWAQYAIAALCSHRQSPHGQSRVAFDGRFRTCYPQSVVDMHFDWLYGHSPNVPRFRSPDSPPCDPSRVLNYKQPELVLLRRRGELTQHHMEMNRNRWVLLYQDAISQVWGLRFLYDDPASPLFIAQNRRVVHDRLAMDSVTWPAIYDRELGHTPQRELAELANLNSGK